MKNTINHSLGLLFLISVAITSGCGRHEAPEEAPVVKVNVMEVGKSSGAGVAGSNTFSGTVLSGEESLVSFSVPGKITNIYVEKGDKVAKGQILAKVRSQSLGNERNIAQAELEQVKDLYNRLKILHDQNALPEVKWVEVQAKLKQAENAVAIADRAVGDASLTAPISGYVADKLADVGQDVMMAQPVMKIVDTGRLKISISVPEEDISRFGATSTADISFPALDDLTVKGASISKAVEADPLTRSYEVRFDIPDGGGKILPGMIGNVEVAGLAPAGDADAGEGFVVPSQAVLLSADNRQFVWVVCNGMAQRKFVKASELRDNGVAVESGLARGDSLIVGGMQKVGTGTHVVATK